MNAKVIIATVGYTIGTFVLAILWHIVLFKEQYETFRYIESEPNFALGFSSILLQGIVLSGFYAYLKSKLALPPMKYVLIMGAFFWTSHVLAFIAKQDVPNTLQFVGMETIYLALQLGLFGSVLSFLYRRPAN